MTIDNIGSFGAIQYFLLFYLSDVARIAFDVMESTVDLQSLATNLEVLRTLESKTRHRNQIRLARTYPLTLARPHWVVQLLFKVGTY